MQQHQSEPKKNPRLNARLPSVLSRIAEGIKEGKRLFLLQGDLEEFITFNYRHEKVAHWIGELVPGCQIVRVTSVKKDDVEGYFQRSNKSAVILLDAVLLFAERPEETAAMLGSALDNPAAKPIFLNFPIGVALPQIVLEGALDPVQVLVIHDVHASPDLVLSQFLEQKRLVADLDALRPVVRGMSPKDLLSCLEACHRSNIDVSADGLRNERVSLLSHKYGMLGRPVASGYRFDDLWLTEPLAERLGRLAERVHSQFLPTSVLFLGDSAADTAFTFGKALAHVGLHCTDLIQDTIRETRTQFDRIEGLIRSQGFVCLLLGPLEGIFGGTDAQSSPPKSHAAARFYEIMARYPEWNPYCIVIGFTERPSGVPEPLLRAFSCRVAIPPLTNGTAIQEMMSQRLRRSGHEVEVPPVTEDLLPTTRSCLKVVEQRAHSLLETGLGLDESIWHALSAAHLIGEEYEFARAIETPLQLE